MAGFRIESLLGRGGMSVVYVAEQLRLGRKVALKLLATDFGWDDEFRQRFMRESHIAAAIDHPNIIPIYDAGEADGLLYIAMRLVRGPDLKAILKRDGRIGVGRAMFILEQVASALDAAHAHALVHRDVKPANVLVEEETDHVYLSDFGVAKQTTSQGLTSTGHFLGTVDYAAPEQIEGKPVDARTDVYALGCVLYECLVGMPPYEHGTEHAVLQAHLVEPPPSIIRVRSDLSNTLDSVIATAMAKAPDDRFQSCGDLALAARRAAAGKTGERRPAAGTVLSAPAETTAAESAPPAKAQAEAVSMAGDRGEPAIGPSAPTRRPRRRLVLAAAALLLLGGGAAAGIALVSGGGGENAAAPSSPNMPAGSTGATGTAMSSTGAVAATGMSSSTAMSSTGESMTMAKPTGTPEHRLAAMIGGQPAWQCQMNPIDAPATAAASADCSTKVPEYLQINFFARRKALHAAYDRMLALSPANRNRGKCSSTSWGGEIQWFHAPGEPGGRAFCYLDEAKQRSYLVWTSDTVSNILFIARLRGLDHPELFFWWSYLRHRLV